MVNEISPVESDIIDLVNKTLVNPVATGFKRVDGVLMPEHYAKFTDDVENFEVRDDDVWVCSFPKTGTTWTQEMVWCIANDLDFERAKIPLQARFPFFEICALADFSILKNQPSEVETPEFVVNSINFIANLPSPRFIKSHLPFHLLPRQLRTGEKKPKIVYVVRNVKDTCISYFHHCRLLQGFTGNFEEFVTLFRADAVVSAPFWKHVLGFWKKKIEENVLFIKYEDMKKDLPWVIKKTATFLGKNLTTDQLTVLAEHLSFASMKNNPATNNEDLVQHSKVISNMDADGKFMRNGNTDQWKTDMSPEQIELFDNWTRENLNGTRLYF